MYSLTKGSVKRLLATSSVNTVKRMNQISPAIQTSQRRKGKNLSGLRSACAGLASRASNSLELFNKVWDLGLLEMLLIRSNC